MGTGEAVQQLRTLAAAVEDLGSLPNTHADSSQLLVTAPVPGDLQASADICAHMVHIKSGRHTQKINKT